MKIENIRNVRLYQAVKFDGKSDTFFTIDTTPSRRGVQLSIVENIGVLIENERDAILVPFPNISGIYLKTDHHKKEEKKKQELADEAERTKVLAPPKKVKRDPIGAKRL
jgi:hypothetical protein